MLEPSVIVDSGAKAVCASLGDAEEVNVLTEFVRLLLHKSSARVNEVYFGVGAILQRSIGGYFFGENCPSPTAKGT